MVSQREDQLEKLVAKKIPLGIEKGEMLLESLKPYEPIEIPAMTIEKSSKSLAKLKTNKDST